MACGTLEAAGCCVQGLEGKYSPGEASSIYSKPLFTGIMTVL